MLNEKGGEMAMTEILSEKELAAKIGRSPWTVRRMRREEGLPFIKVGSRFFYRYEKVQSWFEEREQASVASDSGEYGKIRAIR